MGKGDVQLYWTCENDTEIGWRADYVELHDSPVGQNVSARVAFPETIVQLKDVNPSLVNKNCLGQIEMVPEQLLVIALRAPYPWGREAPLSIHGLQLDYQSA